MSGQHALLAPSSAPRWVLCAGSVMMEALYPEREERAEAADGIASHWAGSEMLAAQEVAVGQVAPNGIVLSAEMIEGADVYVDTARLKLQIFDIEMHVEERVQIPYVHHEHSWGTPDCWGFSHNPTTGRATLYLLDYKFGHRHIEVFENWQLIDYACGILDALGVDGHADQFVDVEFTIVQPRSYHRDGPVREWHICARDLRGYFNILRNAAEAALQPGAKCTPNPECVDCKARHACEVYQKDAYKSVQMSGNSVPVEMTPAAIGLELHILKAARKRLDGRITGLEQQVESHIARGEHVPYFAMMPTQGRVLWAKPVDEILALGAMFGVDISKPDVITPLQAKKAGIPDEIITVYSQRKTGMELVADDGKQARKVFGK